MVTAILPFMWGRVSTCVRPCRLRPVGVTQAITHVPAVIALYGMGIPYLTTIAIPMEFITADTMHLPASTSA